MFFGGEYFVACIKNHPTRDEEHVKTMKTREKTCGKTLVIFVVSQNL